jgi:hypothetical protein
MKFLAPTTDIYGKVWTSNIKKVVTILLTNWNTQCRFHVSVRQQEMQEYALRKTVEHASTAWRHTTQYNLGNNTTWKYRRTSLQRKTVYEAQPQQGHVNTQTPSMFTQSVARVKPYLQTCASRQTISSRCATVTYSYTDTSRHAEVESVKRQSAAAKYEQCRAVNTSTNTYFTVQPACAQFDLTINFI